MILRKHQAEFLQVIRDIQSGAPIRDIILAVTPGGGKSFIPIVAGKLIESGHADGLAWIVPRQALQDQGEREFINPFSRQLFNHNLIIRSSTNEVNPSKGTNGFVTTYQALGVDDKKTVVQEFSQKRYILILDEYHHVEEGGIWHKALKPIYELAKYVVLMTGTIERGDGKPIAFTRYRNKRPVLNSDESTAVIKYNRTDALREQAILPISFHLSDGRFSWENQDGVLREIDSFDQTEDGEDSAALYTALKTDFSAQLLEECTHHWKETRKTNPGAKMLVVAAEYEQAKDITLMLKRAVNLNAEIATSHNPKNAIKQIKKFKSNNLDVLVTIAMAYEGLDVPPITHICCLTHIRSTPWIEQMVARGVRIDKSAGPYSTQRCHVFAPSDKRFVEVMNRIKKEQIAVLKKNGGADQDEFEMATIPGDGTGSIGPNITPLGSELTGHTEHLVGDLDAGTLLSYVETISEKETRLRSEIARHVNAYAYENAYKPQRINSQIKKRFGKPRENMDVKELEFLKEYLENNCPCDIRVSINTASGISRPRAKRKRVDPKAKELQPVEGYVKHNKHETLYF